MVKELFRKRLGDVQAMSQFIEEHIDIDKLDEKEMQCINNQLFTVLIILGRVEKTIKSINNDEPERYKDSNEKWGMLEG